MRSLSSSYSPVEAGRPLWVKARSAGYPSSTQDPDVGGAPEPGTSRAALQSRARVSQPTSAGAPRAVATESGTASRKGVPAGKIVSSDTKPMAVQHSTPRTAPRT